MGHPEKPHQVISASKGMDMEHKKRPDNEDSEQVPVHQLEFSFQSQHLLAFPVSIFNNAAHVVCLNLNYNRISDLPAGLDKQLVQLRVLWLDGNELTSLPEDIGNFIYLQELSVCENRLSKLPETLCKLGRLKILKATGNSLRHLHYEIGQNDALEVLSVDENNLKQFPPTLGMLSKLKVLEANSNKLQSLPPTLDHLKNLEIVDLSNNQLAQIPESFGKLANLKRVDLSENKLITLCDSFASSATLERLYLSTNSICECPAWFSDLENIVEIIMVNNDLSGAAFPEGFGIKSQRLKCLDIRGNFIGEFPLSFCHLASLETLLLGTPFDSLERNAKFQNGNWLQELPCNFSRLDSLTILRAEENQLRAIPEDFGNLVNLEALYLGGNMIGSLPTSFTKLLSLQILQLSKNRLKTLPDEFGKLESLIELYLDTNKLRVLPASMKNLRNLEILDMSDNKLKHVPQDIISKLTKLTDLNLNGNKYEEDCTEVPFLMRKTNYDHPKAEHRGTWRGRNRTMPEVTLDLGSKEQRLEEEASKSTESKSTGSHTEAVDRDSVYSDEEEDWDAVINQSVTSSSISNEKLPEHIEVLEEEDWESEVQPRLVSSDSEIGQFDLDDEEPVKQHTFIPSPVRFDASGNSSCRINIDLLSHVSTPYVNHAPSIKPSYHYPVHISPGQFDDNSDSEDNLDTKTMGLIHTERTDASCSPVPCDNLNTCVGFQYSANEGKVTEDVVKFKESTDVNSSASEICADFSEMNEYRSAEDITTS